MLIFLCYPVMTRYKIHPWHFGKCKACTNFWDRLYNVMSVRFLAEHFVVLEKQVRLPCLCLFPDECKPALKLRRTSLLQKSEQSIKKMPILFWKWSYFLRCDCGFLGSVYASDGCAALALYGQSFCLRRKRTSFLSRENCLYPMWTIK